MRLWNRLALFASIAGVVAMGSTVAYAAGSGYAPGTTTVPTGTPGGFTQVVTAQTITPTTKTTDISVSVDNTPASIAVATGTFSTTAQVVVTSPVLSQVTASLSSLGLPGYIAIAGLGINVVNTADLPLTGTFLKPITITVHNAAIKPGDKIVEWNAQGTFSTVTSATVGNGVASWSFQQDPAFAVVAPSTLVPGATSPVTGKPFLAEGALGALLVAVGAGVLWQTRRRSHS